MLHEPSNIDEPDPTVILVTTIHFSDKLIYIV